jgi:hypothetical protein
MWGRASLVEHAGHVVPPWNDCLDEVTEQLLSTFIVVEVVRSDRHVLFFALVLDHLAPSVTGEHAAEMFMNRMYAIWVGVCHAETETAAWAMHLLIIHVPCSTACWLLAVFMIAAEVEQQSRLLIEEGMLGHRK